MKVFDAHRKVKAIEELATKRGSTGGLVKRIDENRELLELLQRDAPEFVSSHPWLVGWIEANDQFFTQLDGILDTAKPPHTPENYPRPWPGRVFVIEDAPEIRLGGTQ
jgi:hypothetical protein